MNPLFGYFQDFKDRQMKRSAIYCGSSSVSRKSISVCAFKWSACIQTDALLDNVNRSGNRSTPIIFGDCIRDPKSVMCTLYSVHNTFLYEV